MTTYTITAPPTVATSVRQTTHDSNGSGFYDDGETKTTASRSFKESNGSTFDASGNSTRTFQRDSYISDGFSIDNTVEEDEDATTYIQSGATYSWDGWMSATGITTQSYDLTGNPGDDINSGATSVRVTSSAFSFTVPETFVSHSATTANATKTIETTRATNSTHLTTESGAVVSKTATTTQNWTRSTQTSRNSFRTYTATQSATAFGVTGTSSTNATNVFGAVVNSSQPFNLGGTNTGIRATATVVLLDDTEAGFLATDVVDGFSDWLSNVAEAQSATSFIAYPSFATFAGGVSSQLPPNVDEVITPTTYSTLGSTQTTFTSVNFQGTTYPLPTATLTFESLTTRTLASTLTDYSYSHGPTQTTTARTTATHAGQVGSLTFQGTHTQTATRKVGSSVQSTSSTAVPFGSSETVAGGITEREGSGRTSVREVTWQRTEAIGLSINPDFNSWRRAAGSFNNAAAVASATGFGSAFSISLAGVRHPGVAVKKSQTAWLPPTGTWTYSAGKTATADVAGVTIQSGPQASDTTSAPWELVGSATVSTTTATNHVVNVGGKGADGNPITYTANFGPFRSTAGSRGQSNVAAAASATVAESAERTAWSRALVAEKATERYFTTARYTQVALT
jgi:hypothetical protein